MELTEDPYTIIESRIEYSPILSYKIYRADSGQQWVIIGKCDCCGQCESNNENIVWTGIPVGEPGAEYDRTFATRKDIPVRPDIRLKHNKCKLSGYYLER